MADGVRIGTLPKKQGGMGNHPALFASARFATALRMLFATIFLTLFSATVSLAQSTPAGSVIRNTAYVEFAVPGATRAIASTEAAVTVEPSPSRSSVSIERLASPSESSSQPQMASVGPTQCRAVSGYVLLAAPQVAGGIVIDPATAQPLVSTTATHAGDAVFVRVADADQNRDPALREHVEVRISARGTSDAEQLRLLETTANSGVFVGYVPTALGAVANGNCVLELTQDSQLDVVYIDPRDANDAAAASSLVDPSGVVFDSRTGRRVDGARVRLIDDRTGAPAAVFGDDGVSRYPAEMITGSAVTDSGGTNYRYGPGVYRFPLVAPGRYRLIVEPPGGYQFASDVAIADLQRLPGAPFRLADGSFGNAFNVVAPVATALDLPVDAAGDALVLRKTAGVTVASLGDAVEYLLTIDNPSALGSLRQIRITDLLPRGLSFRRGTVRRDGVAIGDPLVVDAGRRLLFDIPTLAPGQRLQLRYVAEVTIASGRAPLVNVATAAASGGVRSNEARASVALRQSLFRDRGFIIGRVVEGSCAVDAAEARGVANVRVYLEDGRYAVTDAGGRYHFEDVTAGTHVAQMDGDTLPAHLQPAACGLWSRFTGRRHSQFVELRAGALARADFTLEGRPAPQGEAALALAKSVATEAGARVEFVIKVKALPVKGARLLVLLPAGAEARSLREDDGAPTMPVATDGVLSILLGDMKAGDSKSLQLDLAGAVPGWRAVLALTAPDGQLLRTEPLSGDAAAARRSSVVTRGALQRAATVVESDGREQTSAAVARGGEDSMNIDVEAATADPSWLTPREGATPAIASLKVAIQHAVSQRVELRVNGEPVSQLNFDSTQRNLAKTAAVSRWRGIDLRDGDNELVARILAADGSLVTTLTRSVHYGGGAVRAELDREKSVLQADGRTRPVVVLRLFDAYGKPARRGTLGAFRIDPPYRSWWEVQANDDNPLLTSGSREPAFEVGEDGVARVELEPTTQAGYAVVHLRFSDRRQQELRVWLSPAPRDWILVGLASGTVADVQAQGGADLQSQPMADEPALTVDDASATAGRIALFAKGRIRGDFLLTLAYDSARDPIAARRRLQGVIEPDRYYLLYGDGAQQRNEAASSEKLFVRLERREFVALFGDFETGLNSTELARYSRSLTGLKADYGGQTFAASAFAARTDYGRGRDEFRGDGTSGPYRLSRTDIVIGSDKLRVEVRDRFSIDRIVSTRELARFVDYDIDYLAGTVRFKEPVAARDSEFNFQFIIADYETNGSGAQHTVAGARATAQLVGGRLELGTTAILDGADTGDTRVAGADARWHVSPQTEARAELGVSRSDDPSRAARATAWLAEVQHISERLEARATLRSEDAGYGSGQTLSSGGGMRRADVDARWRIRDKWSLQSQLQWQDSLVTAAQRRMASAELRYQGELGNAGVGLRHVEDIVPSNGERRSELLTASVSRELLDRRLTLRAATEQGFGGRDASVDYPSRILLGADWRVRGDTTVFSEWEHADGSAFGSDMTRVGVRAQPWERTQVVSSIDQRSSEFGPRRFANFGLKQGLPIDAHWSADLGVDHSRSLLGQAAQAQAQTLQQPLASGSSDENYFASFAGLQYHDERWTFTSRLERRTADSGDRWSLASGWYREPAAGHALSWSAQWQSEAPRAAAASSLADLRFAWAWRPDGSRWIVLNRTELQRETRDAFGTALTKTNSAEATRLIQNLHANWQLDRQTQLGLQLGLRYAVTTLSDEKYRGLAALAGFDLRRDLRARAFGRALDVGVHGTALESRQSGSQERSFGADVGITLAPNLWVSLGYNWQGFRADGFASDRQTGRGIYLKFRLKADQDTFKDLRLDSLRPAR